MIATQEYYQRLVYNLLDTLEYVADEVMDRGNTDEMEDFIDMASNTIMEFGEFSQEMREYLEERGYGKRE